MIWFWRALTVLYMGAIFYVSHKQMPPAEPLFPLQDKLYHFMEFFFLGGLLRIALPQLKWKHCAFLAVLYGASDEFHQYFVPTRECDFYDWVADAAGATLGAWMAMKFRSEQSAARAS